MKTKESAMPRAISPRDADVKYMGSEPTWGTLPAPADRFRAQLRTFAWYNYYCDSKDAKKFVIDWMSRNGFPATDTQRVARINERDCSTTPGWLCRIDRKSTRLNSSH